MNSVMLVLKMNEAIQWFGYTKNVSPLVIDLLKRNSI